VVEDLDGIGVPGTHALVLDLDEQRKLAEAVRESVRRQLRSFLQLRGVTIPADALECQECGERTILLDQPKTYVHDHDRHICSACGAERDFVRMVRPPADIGGEGG